MDRACSRFDRESELSRLNASPNVVTSVSPTFGHALRTALTVADLTNGLVTPTILPALRAAGYDRDYDAFVRETPVEDAGPVPVAPLSAVHFDEVDQTVWLEPGCELDLGATAKALTADLVANDMAQFGGVVVEIGGDVAVRGNGPDGPWAIGVSDQLNITGTEPRISIAHGGVATSSLTTRTWATTTGRANHIIDPRTGTSATGPIATATVTAGSCVLANAFATAALLWGNDAANRLEKAGWSGRLVGFDREIIYAGGWPREEVCAP